MAQSLGAARLFGTGRVTGDVAHDVGELLGLTGALGEPKHRQKRSVDDTELWRRTPASIWTKRGREPMSESSDITEAPEPMDGESTAPSPEQAEEILEDPAGLMGFIQKRPELLQHLAAGYRTVREGFTDFLTANDRGGDRLKHTADKVIHSIDDELKRGGLSADERYRLIETEERILGRVDGSEKEAREANERSFGKLVAAGATATVGIVVLGYLAKEGKLPPISPANRVKPWR